MVMRLAFSYSAIEYLPFPTLRESEFRKAHRAIACKFDFLLSSDEKKSLYTFSLATIFSFSGFITNASITDPWINH